MNKRKVGSAIILSFLALLIVGVILALAGIPLATGGSPVLLIVGGVLSVVGFVLLITIVAMRNGFVRMKNMVEESLALIDIQLKNRFDLIPNLVNTVKGYAEHEKSVFTQVTKLRNLALKTEDEKEKIDCANKIVPLMKTIFAVSENYPELKSNEAFRNLMEELSSVEDRIAAARRIYDSNVNIYNSKVEAFPQDLIARLFGFEKVEYFKIATNERNNVEVNLE
ncbi:MAG: LemA family protein [Clostridia bacterium]|nr:LemA family protein [Clostridia bacterium]